jgi:hypothetical protein
MKIESYILVIFKSGTLFMKSNLHGLGINTAKIRY